MNIKRLLESQVARDYFLEFIKYTWEQPTPYIVGKHTAHICARLDRALEDYRKGVSSHIILTVPFRHGKSEIVSRRFPPYALGHFPEAEVILMTYSQSLSNAMSRDARKMFSNPAYHEIFSKERLALDPSSSSVENWGIGGHRGKFQSVGIGGASTGKGADILIVDDYLSGRADAESQVIRDKGWEDFAGNFMTRLAPVHICVILATRWHTDDIIGRIEKKMTEDPEFPHFEKINFPAFSGDYPSGTLFPERFGFEWYQMQQKTLGKYQTAALMQGEPFLRGGNLLKTENIQYAPQMPGGLRWVRFWDLASTKDERMKDDPDYTVGAKCAVSKKNGIQTLYIDDVVYLQAEAPERDRVIVETAKRDGSSVYQLVESVAGYKDTYANIKALLNGVSIVQKVGVSKDKTIRVSVLEPLFEAGNVVMKKAWWNEKTVEQLSVFPAGAHDDIPDAIAGAFEGLKPSGGFLI